MKNLASALALSAILTLPFALCGAPVLATNDKIEARQSQITTDPRYDRDPSLFRAADNTYWLFFARGRDPRGVRDLAGYNPDLDYYDIYFKTAKSIPGLEKAHEMLLPVTPPDNAQRDVSALQTSDGRIWVFTSTGLGPGSQRSVYYYTYDGDWHGPTLVPGTDYAAHISVLESGGRIWIFFDIGYALKVVSADATAVAWSSPIAVADDATIAKAIVDEGKFYVVWTTPSGSGIYLSTSSNGTTWSTTAVPIAAWPDSGATNWDPVLIKDKDIFRLVWAPDAGSEGQFLATTTSPNPIDETSWSTPLKLTTASSGADNWWDFWPQPYAKGVQYLFYTSERNATATGRADGNIWMMRLKP